MKYFECLCQGGLLYCSVFLKPVKKGRWAFLFYFVGRVEYALLFLSVDKVWLDIFLVYVTILGR